MAFANPRIGLRHKIAAIGATGLAGLLVVGGIYMLGAGSKAPTSRSRSRSS